MSLPSALQDPGPAASPRVLRQAFDAALLARQGGPPFSLSQILVLIAPDSGLGHVARVPHHLIVRSQNAAR